jgi:transposase
MQDSGHTPQWSGPAVERVMSHGKRVFALAFKRWLVGQASQPGASVAGLALRHGINANQLGRWIKVERGRAGQGMALLPVTVRALPAPADRAIAVPPDSDGHIEVEIFGARLKLHGCVNGQSLGVVLDALAHRA